MKPSVQACQPLVFGQMKDEPKEDDEDNAYSDICKQIDGKYGYEDTESKIDKLYKVLKMQNNRLQDIKVRKASKYDQSTIENELKR